MSKVIIESDIPALNGSYELDPSYFTNRELHLIKTQAGVRAGEIGDALEAGDNDVLVVLAMIALKRSGKDVPADALWDLEAGKITIDVSDTEGTDALPPPLEPERIDATDPSSPASRNDGEVSPELMLLRATGSPG